MIQDSSEIHFISVIVPVLNNPNGIGRLLSALTSQTYPPDQLEILVVDNGSSDATPEIVRSHISQKPHRIRLLEQTQIKGSYAARNLAIPESRGDLLVFIDADCDPISCWLEYGVNTLMKEQADLAGGKVTFTYAGPTPSAAERIDARTNMQMEQDILNRGVTKTANLFVRKRLFDELGLFRDDLKSGGDVEWTSRATAKGYKLVYASGAEIRHPARGWRELFIKQVRVGRGQILQRTGKRLSTGTNVLKTGRSLQSVISRGDETFFGKTAMLIALLWARMGTLVGRLQATVEQLARKNR